MKIAVPQHIRALKPYVPGKPIAALEQEYGIADAVKLASNENPLGPSPKALAALAAETAGLNRYPNGGSEKLVGAISARLGVAPECIILGSGSDDVISMLTRALLSPGDEVVIPQPTFLMYEFYARCAGATPVFVPLSKRAIDLEAVARSVTPNTRIIFLCSPNNPTGQVIAGAQFAHFLSRIPKNILVVVDQAYAEYMRDPGALDGLRHVRQKHAVAVLRTFSKAYGLAGLRIGYGVMPPELVRLLQRVRQPFNVNSLAQAAATGALADDDFLEKSVRLAHEGLDFLWSQLDRMGVRYHDSQANFFLIDVGRDADRCYEMMLRRGVIVRSMRAYGYAREIRLSVGLPVENQRFLDAFETVLTT